MKAEIRRIFVDPCLGFKRIGLKVSFFKMKRDGNSLAKESQINNFYDNHFSADGIMIGDILCHVLIAERSNFSGFIEEYRSMVVIGISEKEIEFSPVFDKLADFFAYLDEKK